MRAPRLFVLAILAMAFPPSPFALETSASVKARTLVKSGNSWDGKPIRYPAGKPEITGMVIEIAPGAETGWHLHAVPSFAMVIEGELEVRLKNGSVNRLKSGDALIEVVDTLHNGRNIGSVPVKLVVFYAGTAGQALSATEDSR